MECPNCGTYNGAGNLFCISCGQPLPASQPGRQAAATPVSLGGSPAEAARRHLGVQTIRLLLALLVLFVFYRVLIGLSFVENLVIPEVPLSAVQIIRSVVFVVAVILLLGYGQTLQTWWSRAFPRWTALSPLLMALVYVAAIAAIYSGLSGPLFLLVDDATDLQLILRIVLLVLAAIILSWAWLSFYQSSPDWLSNLRLSVASAGSADVACLNCGYLNPASNQHCGRCGHSLGEQAGERGIPAVPES